MKRQHNCAVDASVDTSTEESVNQWLKEIGGRIKHARGLLHMTQEAFAEAAGAKSKSGLQDNERGKAMPGGHIIGALAKRGINTNWIFTGDGEPFLEALYPQGHGATHRKAAEPGQDFNPLLLQQVVDFFFSWMQEHRVKIDQAKYGAVIAILYRIAARHGKVVNEELAQVLAVAA